ncbi:MAG: helix-turn-helix domain-containing protein [Planctomycetaceae bacterium]|nr:helix-turn-helix domain-containing protein [Planctomycetaceae bacterium]
MGDDEMQKLLKSSEVMEVLGVCKTTFWKLVNDGELPVVECGKLKRWRPEVVEQFIESHTKGVK